MLYHERAEIVRQMMNLCIVANEDKEPHFRMDLAARVLLESETSLPFIEVNMFGIAHECDIPFADVPATWYLDNATVENVVKHEREEDVAKNLLEIVKREHEYVKHLLNRKKTIEHYGNYAWA